LVTKIIFEPTEFKCVEFETTAFREKEF